MKILQVCPRYFPDMGGVEEHVRNISENLSKRHEVTVATTDQNGKLPKEEIINGVEVFRFRSWAPSHAYYFSPRLKKYLELNSKNFDVVHAHSYHAFPALYASQSKRGNRFVFTAHYDGTGHTFFRAMLHRPYKVVGQEIFKKADKIICVSKYEKDSILKNFQINEEKMTLIPNGVNATEFSSFKKNDRGYRFILYVGRLAKSKGIHHLIKAVPKIDPDIILEVVGDGPFGRTLTQLAEEYDVKNRVVFRQNLDRQALLQEYVDASLFVSLSKCEAYGITIAEALTAGVPCLVANATALTEWIDNKCCFGINFPINTDDLVARINENIGKKINKPNLPNWNDTAELISKTYDGLF